MVITPFGRMPASCVHPVGLGENTRLQPIGDTLLMWENDEMKEIPPCHTRQHVKPSLAKADNANNIPNYYAYASWFDPPVSNYSVGFTAYYSNWTVPQPPPAQQQQTLFLFTSLQDILGDVVQSVLQWGVSGAGGGHYWTIASWYILNTGAAVHSPLMRVEPGDIIRSYMYTNTYNWTWTLKTANDYTGEVSFIQIQSTLSHPAWVYYWTFVGLQAYDIVQCANFPPGQVLFADLDVRNPVTRTVPFWSVKDHPGCNEGVVLQDHQNVIIVF